MSAFTPEQNTMICMYGPPGSFDDPERIEIDPAPAEAESFFDKIVSFFKRIFDFIKGLFNRN